MANEIKTIAEELRSGFEQIRMKIQLFIDQLTQKIDGTSIGVNSSDPPSNSCSEDTNIESSVMIQSYGVDSTLECPPFEGKNIMAFEYNDDFEVEGYFEVKQTTKTSSEIVQVEDVSLLKPHAGLAEVALDPNSSKKEGGVASTEREDSMGNFLEFKQAISVDRSPEVFIGFGPGGFVVDKEIDAIACALNLFAKIPEQGIVPRTPMVDVCFLSRNIAKVVDVFEERSLRIRDTRFVTSLLNGHVPFYDFSWLLKARKVFDRYEILMIAWKAVSVRYVHGGLNELALDMLGKKSRGEVKPDDFMLATFNSCCYTLVLLFQCGQQVQGYILRIEDCITGGKLLLKDATNVLLSQMPYTDLESFNTMISFPDQHGCGVQTFDFSQQMLKENIIANQAILLSQLSDVYATAERWNVMAKRLKVMTHMTVCEDNGCNLGKADNKANIFLVDVTRHYVVQELAYVFFTSVDVSDMESNHKEVNLHAYLEKFTAIFAFMEFPCGSPI